MPDKNIPPDWYLTFFGIFWTALAGVFGAFLRQIVTPQRGWINRILGWIGGAICSVYMSPTLTHVMITLLDKHGLIDHSVGLSNVNVAGLAGLVSGAIGITLIESILIFLKNRFGVKSK